MAGVWFWLQRDWRARWRSSLAVAALVAVTGGTVLALLAGTRRTHSSLGRFDRVALDGAFVDASDTDPGPLRSLARHPQVHALGEVAFMAAFPPDGSYFPLLAGVDGVAGREVFRGRLLRGRRPNPAAPLEVALAETTARRLGADVGARLRFASLTPAEWAAARETGDFPDPPHGPTVELRVVGVLRTGFDLARRVEDPSPTILTPAFFEAYRGRMGTDRGQFLLRMTGGPGAEPLFGRLLKDAYRGAPTPVLEPGDAGTGPRGSVRVVGAGLVAMAVVAAGAGLGWLALALHRHAAAAVADLGVLAALGLGHRAQLVLLAGTTGPALVGGSLAAVAAAVAASPLLPVGLARRADPDVGFHADLAVLVPGVAALLAAGGALALLGGARARRGALAGRGRVAARAPGVGERIGARLGPVATTGLAFALQPGRGPRAAPVRPALAGAVAGLAGVVAAVVVGASMGRLVDTPARYGAPWDVAVSAQGADRAAIAANRDVEAAAVGLFQRPVTIGGRSLFASAVDPIKGGMGPTMAAGRAPGGPDEVALGGHTLERAGLGIGDVVTVAARGRPPTEFRVVGQAVFPSPDDAFPVADGALLTAAGLDRLGLADATAGGQYGFRRLLLRWRPGVDRAAALARLGDIAEEPDHPAPGAEVARLAEVERFPQALAAFLAAVSLIAVAHGLGATVRRRRHDLAVLAALGLTRRQRRGVVAWQAGVLAVAGSALGLPLGAAVGRWVWAAMAGDLGVATDAAVPPAATGLTVAGTVAVFALLAAWSGRGAARLRSAEILRAE